MIKKNIFVLLLSTSLARADLNIPLQKNIEPPTLLSKTGLFQGEMTNLQPAKELITYDINQALWVDFAKKLRFLYLPTNKKIIFQKMRRGFFRLEQFWLNISKWKPPFSFLKT